MHIIILDPERMLDYNTEKQFRADGIDYFHTKDPQQALKAYIQDADIDAFLALIKSDEGISVFDTLHKLHNLNPTLPVLCVFKDKKFMQDKQQSMESLDIAFRSLEEKKEDHSLAASVRGLLKGVVHKRGAHRVNWKLQALLYEHNGLDQKIEESLRMVSVISLSANGAYIAAGKYEPEKGKTYLFEISFPDFIFIVKGKIVWSNPDNTVPGRPRGFALVFMEMSQVPRQLLQHMIEQELIDTILEDQGAL